MRRAVGAAVLLPLAAALVACAPGTLDPSPGTTSNTVTSSSSAPEVVEHVHLGDSYASGTGVQPLLEGSPFLCMRSQRNYGQLLSEEHGWKTTDVSCAGATTDDLTDTQYEGSPPQLDALDDSTDVVTLTLGGNDSDVFSTAVGECTRRGREDPSGAPCADVVERLTQRLQNRTAPALTEGFRAIREAAPNAKIYVVGYPWITPDGDGCYDEVPIAAGDLPGLHRLNATLNEVVRAAAEDADGVTYVDMAARSEGHDACAGEGQRWVEPMIGGPASMHPNAAGQQAMAVAVDAARG